MVRALICLHIKCSFDQKLGFDGDDFDLTTYQVQF